MKCSVCSNDSWNYLFEARDRMFGLPGKFGEYRCTRCGFVRLDPKPKDVKKYYPPQKYYSYSDKSNPSFFSWLRSFLIRHRVFSLVPAMPQASSGRILDVGCGSGDTLLLLKQVGWDVYGMDIDSSAVKVAKKRGLKNVSTKRITGFPDNYFDVIRAYHVIEHLESPKEFLQNAQTKLKAGGKIIIGTPNVDSLVAKVFGSRWYNLDAPRHLFLFSPKTLSKIVKPKFSDIHISFHSAGGWVGSIQYLFGVDLINRQWLVMLFYPLEWILDRLGLGDVFVLRARKP